MIKKKVICLITNWYPTEDNPFGGVFFRDQILALKEYYDFWVVHYQISYSPFREKHRVTECKREENITEYNMELVLSKLMRGIRNRLVYKGAKQDIYLKERFVNAFIRGLGDSFDVLYCVDAQTEAGYLKMIADACGKPYVVSEHGVVPWLGSVVDNIHKQAIEKAALLLAISYEKLRQIKMQDIITPPYIYVGNLVDEEQFTYKVSGNEVKTFVMVGAHVFYKNYGMLIDVMNQLKQITDKPFKVLIVGYAANKGYSKETCVLEKAIEASDFADCVEMIPAVEHSRMQEIYQQADAFVMTSIQEGMPVSALEAGCCGLPIFATHCGGVEDFVTDQIGRIYGVFDVEQFAQGLCDFLEGRIVFDSECIRKSIIEKFGKEAFIKNMVYAFESVTKDKSTI